MGQSAFSAARHLQKFGAPLRCRSERWRRRAKDLQAASDPGPQVRTAGSDRTPGDTSAMVL
eukprot:5046879-Alexandrium_andersonii.AAC.1